MYHWTHVYDWYIQLYLCGDEKKSYIFSLKYAEQLLK